MSRKRASVDVVSSGLKRNLEQRDVIGSMMLLVEGVSGFGLVDESKSVGRTESRSCR